MKSLELKGIHLYQLIILVSLSFVLPIVFICVIHFTMECPEFLKGVENLDFQTNQVLLEFQDFKKSSKTDEGIYFENLHLINLNYFKS